MEGLEALKVENKQLKAENTKLIGRISELEDLLTQERHDNSELVMTAAGMSHAVVGLGTVAEDATWRAAVAESVNKNSNHIHDLEQKIQAFEAEADALRKDNEGLRKDNEGLRKQNKVLEERCVSTCGRLENANEALDARIKSLEAKASTMDASFAARDAMRHLEWFISREAVLAHGMSKTQFKKRKLYNFQRLKEAGIALPTWISTRKQMVTLIVHYKEDGNKMVHGEINETAVRSAIEEDDDDTEDIAIKTDMIDRLKKYYAGDNMPFGTAPGGRASPVTRKMR